MKKTIFILVLFLTSHLYIFPNDKASIVESTVKSTKTEEFTPKVLYSEIQQLKIENIQLKTEVDQLKNSHNEQVTYYQSIINLIFWVVGFMGIVITLGFSLFIWTFKEPKVVFSKIMSARKEIKELTKNFEHDLNNEYKQQSTIFLLGRKGLYSYTEYDWEKIKVFARLAEKIDENKRKSEDWYFIGSMNFHSEKYEAAIEALKKVIEIDKLNDSEYLEVAYKDLGNTYDEFGKYNEAIDCYNKVLEINSNSYRAYNNLGIAYTGLENYEKAFECFNRSLEIDESQEYVYTNYFEYNLTLDEEFNPKLLRKYRQLFKEKNKENIKTHSIFEMLNVYMQIKNGENNVEELLNSWKEKGYYVADNSNYREIKKWIEKQTNLELKEKLLTAYNFFDQDQKRIKSTPLIA
jgi:tetratricopeptide (TPR) repeat protein